MGADARSRVIEGHLPLVRSVAGRYVGRGESLDDLVQVGTIGLIKAVDRFDPDRDRVPRPEHELAARLRSAAAELTARHRRARALLDSGWRILDERERRMLELRFREERSQAEIARELGLSQAHVSRLLRLTIERLRAEVGAEAAADPAQGDNGDGAGGRPRAARSGRLLLRLPQTLHSELAAAAEREGVPLNTFIAGTLAGAVGWQDPAEPEGGRPSRSGRRGPTTLLIVNAVVIALAALAGVGLLLAAWLGG